MEEIWKEIDGYNGDYLVSNLGEVKSLKSGIPKILSQNLDVKGYWYVPLSCNGIRKNQRIHRLVAQAFLPNNDNLDQVNHKNLNKDDNTVSNLEWCSSAENIAHYYSKKYGEEKGLEVLRGIKEREELRKNGILQYYLVKENKPTLKKEPTPKIENKPVKIKKRPAKRVKQKK